MKRHDSDAPDLLSPIAGDYLPSSEDRERVLRKIRERLVEGAAAGSSANAAASPPVASNSFRRLGTKIGLGALVVLGAFGVFEVTRGPGLPPSEGSKKSDVTIADAEPSAASPPSLEAPAIAVDSLPTALPEPTKGRESIEVDDPLARETRLLTRAGQASRDGNGTEALRVLDAHAREFPHGVLADERAVERIIVLCSLGRQTDAERDARDFFEKHGPSPLRRRVEASCAGKPLSPGAAGDAK